MKPCVVDASVVAAAFFQEKYAAAATRLLVCGAELYAPDLIYAEFANVIWKHFVRKKIDEEEASQLLADFTALPLRTVPSDELVDSALPLALRTGRTVYDCLYLAMAVKRHAVMVTADRRLVNALADSPLEKHLAWIGSDS